jgi:hypothetical protein
MNPATEYICIRNYYDITDAIFNNLVMVFTSTESGFRRVTLTNYTAGMLCAIEDPRSKQRGMRS